MRKLLAAILLTFLFFFCARAEEPVLMGSAEIPDLMKLTENLGRLADKFSPGSSAKIVLGVTALSFSPQLAAFDVTSPLRVLLYGRKGPEKKITVEWCLALKKKKEYLPESIALGEHGEMHVKQDGDYGIISSSKELLASLKSIPKPSDSEADLNVCLYPENALPFCKDDMSGFRTMLIGMLVKSETPEETDLSAGKALQVKIAYAEKLLPQIASLKIDLFIQDKDLNLSLALQAKKGSELEKFLAAQAQVKNSAPALCKDKLSSGFVNLSLTPALKQELSEMLRELMLELSDDEKTLQNTELLAKLCTDFSGDASYFTEIKGELPVTLMKIALPEETAKKFTQKLAEKKAAAQGQDGLFLITSSRGPHGKKLNLFCKAVPTGMALMHGPIEAEDAAKLLAAATSPAELPKGITAASRMAGIFSVPAKGKDMSKLLPAGFFAVECKDGSALFEFSFKIDVLKDLVPMTRTASFEPRLR